MSLNNNGKGIIFIASQPRSGSTLLQAIVSNNSSINTISEPWVFLAFANFFRPDLVAAEYDNRLAIDAFEQYIQKVDNLDLVAWLRSSLEKLYAPLFKPNYSYVLDKTPRYYEILSDTQKIFPESKIIILKRNPIDVVRSIITTWGYHDVIALLRHKRDILDAPLLIHEFCKANRNNERVTVVRYEDIITNTEKTIKGIYAWLNIEYTPDVLKIKRNEKYLGTYGDPYINEGQNDIGIRKNKQKLSKQLERFISAYANYLSEDFLYEYGNYDYKNAKKAKVFDFYRNAESFDKYHNRYGLKKELKLKFYKWGLKK